MFVLAIAGIEPRLTCMHGICFKHWTMLFHLSHYAITQLTLRNKCEFKVGSTLVFPEAFGMLQLQSLGA